jgi:D-alanyl-lipoteichoic acid acyltransferase DltB (MBOAT superfamily)
MRKLARVRDCLSFLVSSSRVIIYMVIIMRRKFSQLSFSVFSFFFLLVLSSSVHKLYMLAFPFQFFLLALRLFQHRPKDSFFSRFFFLFPFFPITSMTRFYPLLSCNKANDHERREEKKLSLLLPSSLYAYIAIVFSFSRCSKNN